MHGSPAQRNALRASELEAPLEPVEAANHLEWLHTWYTRHCNGLWEHTAGLRLETEEPRGRRTGGWRLTIELAGTGTSVAMPRTFSLTSFCGGWLSCSLTSERFTGAGDVTRLEELIGVFRHWLEHAAQAPRQVAPRAWLAVE